MTPITVAQILFQQPSQRLDQPYGPLLVWGVGADSNPAIGLGLVVALTLAFIGGERMKEETMKTGSGGGI